MAERKKQKKKDKDGDQKLTKQENAVAKFVRFNCPTKSTMLRGDEAHYFTASKAVDTLIESSKYGKSAKKPMFNDRKSAINFMGTLLDKGLFWRARKLIPKRKERPGEGKEKKAEKTDTDNNAEKSPKKSRGGKKEKGKKQEDEASEQRQTKDKDDKADEEKDSKKKKKIKLDIHSEQIFIDGPDVYVWVFDPTPLTKWLIGLGLVLGSIMVCLFPLWPDWLRVGIYYLSVFAMGLVGLLIATAILRTVFFGIVWLCSMGKHHFWLLPNLTEDCGVMESFKPTYTYEYKPMGWSTKDDPKKTDSSDKAKKKKDDDYEENVAGTKDGDEDVNANREDDDNNRERAGGTNNNTDDDDDDDNDNDASEKSDDENEDGRDSQRNSTEEDNHDDEPQQQQQQQTARKRKNKPRRADDDFEMVQ